MPLRKERIERVHMLVMYVVLCWRSRRAPGRTGVWLARAAEICSFLLAYASLPLTLPRATASPSHNHSDTISSLVLIFSSSSSSRDLLSFLLCHSAGLLSSLGLSGACISALISLFLLNFCPLSLVFLYFVHFSSTIIVLFPPQVVVHLSLSALLPNSQKATFVLTVWQPLHHPQEWFLRPLLSSHSPFSPSQIHPHLLLFPYLLWLQSCSTPLHVPPPPLFLSSSSAALPEDRADAARQNSQHVPMFSYSSSAAAAALLHLSVPMFYLQPNSLS